jgi:hypothetical protein
MIDPPALPHVMAGPRPEDRRSVRPGRCDDGTAGVLAPSQESLRKQGFHHEDTKNTKTVFVRFAGYLNGRPRSTKISCPFVFFVSSW